MMRPYRTILTLLTLFAGAALAAAATPEQIITETRTVKDISSQADALKAKLATEVSKVVAAGRLAPFRTQYGEGGLRYHWREPWNMVYTLSRALPYLDADLAAKVKAYLKEEIAARPPWNEGLLGPEGTLRQPADVSRDRFNAGCRPGQTQSAFFAYALWTYAEASGDTQTIKDHWADIKKFFAYKANSPATLETASGWIGMYRLARLVGDDTVATDAMARAKRAVEACGTFDRFAAAATKTYTGRENWRRGTHGILYAFFNLTPEAARILTSSDELKKAANQYAESGKWTWPLWWMAQAPIGDGGYYGEGCCTGPEQREMLFGYEAWVAGTPAKTLAMYVDVPDALVGDNGYIRNLVTTIEAFGASSWGDAAK